MNSQRGSAAIILFFALGLVALSGGAYFFYRSGPNSAADKGMDPAAAFLALQAKVEKVFAEAGALNSSVDRNPNPFSCLSSARASCDNAGGAFVLYESADASSHALSQLVQGTGTLPDGRGCRNFPNVTCPLRVEAAWSPVCSPNGPCENTRSARLKVRVLLDEGNGAPQEWTKEEVITPNLKVSKSVACERDGGVWAATECVTHEQARQLASGGSHDSNNPRLQQEAAPPILPDAPRFSCEDQIVIQGVLYQLENTAQNRAQVRVPAMNGCPAEDEFTFQCQPKSAEDRDGQWIQIEAKMAPGCDENGAPIQPETNR